MQRKCQICNKKFTVSKGENICPSCMAKKEERVKIAEEKRVCGRCGTDISNRHKLAQYCQPCAYERSKERANLLANKARKEENKVVIDNHEDTETIVETMQEEKATLKDEAKAIKGLLKVMVSVERDMDTYLEHESGLAFSSSLSRSCMKTVAIDLKRLKQSLYDDAIGLLNRHIRGGDEV